MVMPVVVVLVQGEQDVRRCADLVLGQDAVVCSCRSAAKTRSSVLRAVLSMAERQRLAGKPVRRASQLGGRHDLRRLAGRQCGWVLAGTYPEASARTRHGSVCRRRRRPANGRGGPKGSRAEAACADFPPMVIFSADGAGTVEQQEHVANRLGVMSRGAGWLPLLHRRSRARRPQPGRARPASTVIAGGHSFDQFLHGPAALTSGWVGVQVWFSVRGSTPTL